MDDYSRVTGLVSNLDTKGLVNSMLKIERVRVDRVKADQTRMKWKQEGYREIATMLKGLESAHFDILNKKDDLRLSSNYSAYEAVIKSGGEETSAVSAKILSSANFDTIEIEEIQRLATAEKHSSKFPVKKMTANIDMDKLNQTLQSGGVHEMSFKVDGREKSIELNMYYSDFDELKADLQSKLNTAFGEHVVNLKEFEYENLENGTIAKGISFESNNHDLEYLNTASNQELFTGGIGLTAGINNKFDIKGSMEQLGGLSQPSIDLDVSFLSEADNEKKSIVKIKSTDSIEDIIKKFNKGQHAATLKYDKLTRKFTLTSNKTGGNGELSFNNEETEMFFSKLGLSEKEEGHSALIKINGDYITNDSNTLKLNGAKITFNEVHLESEGKISIGKKYDAGKIKESVKDFVKKYNEIIDKVNTLVKEKKFYKYNPLTDEQKKEMKKEEIERWEEKAKSGLFRNDNVLTKILSDLRGVFSDKVEGTEMSASKLGLYFTDNYKDGGKIRLDEDKFDKAFKEDSENAIHLLTASSEIRYGNKVLGAKARYNENGIMQRISDIIKDNIKTTRTDTGKKDEKGEPIYSGKGYLVEKAGIKGTSTEFGSELSKKIRKMNRRIDFMMDALFEKENQYYLEFARLETALSQVSAQSNAFAGFMGGGM